MVEGAAYDYLQALVKGDEETVNRLGVVEDPPSIRSFRDLKRDNAIANPRTKGDFTPIARLHRSIEKKFDYDPRSGRFTPKDALGTAAAVLDAGHDAKARMEKDGTYNKMASGDPEEAMQAAIDFGGVFAKLSEGLSPQKLIPSYRMLVENAKPPLTGPELALAMDYAAHREVWDALLKRPFPTLKAQGPFQFEKAELTATVRDKLASSGDPPTTVRLRLVRFRMDAIDTGWKVVAARRVKPGEPFEPEVEPEPTTTSPTPEPASPGDLPRPSPGELAIPPDLIPKDLTPR